MKVQLGGGTDIAPALEYARSLVVQPRRTILVLVTDFFDFGEPRPLKSVTAKLASDGVVLLGLAALDDRAKPAYCEPIARSLAKIGMTIAAMTPDRLAEWVAERVRA
jgi:Mg-chelatase subunit ChlD